jgi:lysophospholipase L1-like esterase
MRRLLLISLLVCTFAANAAACKKADSPTGPSPTGNVVYAAIGASDGIGYGSSAPCIVFDPNCPSGMGYVYVLKRRLQAEGRDVALTNLSVPGAVISPAFQTLARDIGRNDIFATFFNQANSVPRETTHVTIFTGGNDANVIGENVAAGRGAADIRGFVDQHVQQFGNDLVELVSRVRSNAPNARIVAINLPNLGAAPYVAGRTTLEKAILQRIAVGLTDRINALTSQNVIVADMMCDSRVYEPGSFSADGFHPSDRGYALMADLAYPALANGTAPSPSSTCPQRSLIPIF